MPPRPHQRPHRLAPAARLLAAVRGRLLDAGMVINQTLVYAGLTVALLALYFAIVLTLQSTLRGLAGEQSSLAIVISTVVIALAFNPLRLRLQAAVDRRFYRRKYDVARTLAKFNASARDEVELDELSEKLLSVIDEAMQPRSVALWLTDAEDIQRPR